MQFFKRYKIEFGLVGLVLALLLGLVFVTSPTGKSDTSALSKITGVTPAAKVDSITDKAIAAYQDKVRANPKDAASYASLGLAYLQKAREVGDPTYYTKAEEVFKKTLELDPKNVEATGGMGSLALSRHQFADGLDWGKRAQALRPQMAYNYGVIGDALVELGRYDEAVTDVQLMVNLRPDVSSYARVSYLRELYGKSDAAIEAMQSAIQAGGQAPENTAWVTYQLGELYFNRGNLAKAEETYNQALSVLPKYVYAQEGLAKVKAANGDLTGALTLFTTAIGQIPLPQFVIEAGDVYALAGKTGEAKKQYDLVRAIEDLYRANGVNTDMEMALFDADHDLNLPQALAHAKEQMAARPSIKAADVLAWTLYKSGDYKAAKEASTQALRLGTQDALAFFHAGMIAAKLGQTDEARKDLEKALAINPNFSFLHKDTARKTLTELGGSAATK